MKRSTILIAIGALAGILSGTLAAWSFLPRNVAALDDFDRYVFVPSSGAPEVTVLDSRNDAVVATLGLSMIPDRVVVSKILGVLVASDPPSKTLTVIDLRTRKIDSVIPIGITPTHLRLSPDAYLVAIGDSERGAVSVVSLLERRTLFQIDGFSRPYNPTFNIDGSMIYVSELGADRVKVVDLSLQKVIEAITVPHSASSDEASDARPKDVRGILNVTRSVDGRLGFVTLQDSDRLTVVNLDNGQPIKTLQVGKQPSRAYATGDGRYMLVPNNADRTVTVIDAHALDVVATLPGAADVTAIDTGWFESVAYVISSSESTATILDLMKLEKKGEISLPFRPDSGVVTPDGAKLYVALSGSDRVAVIDTRSGTLSKVIDHVGSRPWGTTMGHANNYCH